MGFIQGHSLHSYWEAGTCYAPVADAMVQDRFAKLTSTMPFEDNLATTEDKKLVTDSGSLGNGWMTSEQI